MLSTGVDLGGLEDTKGFANLCGPKVDQELARACRG